MAFCLSLEVCQDDSCFLSLLCVDSSSGSNSFFVFVLLFFLMLTVDSFSRVFVVKNVSTLMGRW